MKSKPSSKQALQGFTLLELMVALMIFAMLALAGWQITDSLSKSRELTQQQIKQLSDLNYAYLQLSQDFSQIIHYIIRNDHQNQPSGFLLNSEGVEFVRFANPDPRYISPPVLEKVKYAIVDQQLIKYKTHQLQANQPKIMESILLKNVENFQWTALTPDRVNSFPTGTVGNSSDNHGNMSANGNFDASQKLPKGIELQFSYHGQPIVWLFALPSVPPQQVKSE